MKKKNWLHVGIFALLIIGYALLYFNADSAHGKLPKDLTGYKLDAFTGGSKELLKIANGRALVVVFATPT